MDATYLDPRNVNGELVGTMYECAACGRQRLFEEGNTYLITVVREERANYVFAWFCSLACLTSKIKGGTA